MPPSLPHSYLVRGSCCHNAHQTWDNPRHAGGRSRVSSEQTDYADTLLFRLCQLLCGRGSQAWESEQTSRISTLAFSGPSYAVIDGLALSGARFAEKPNAY